jgi:hypothetical protein
MAWIKRNLLFVVGLVVAFALLGGGVLYLVGNLQDADGVSAELTGKNEALDALVKRPTYPNSKNIELVKVEQQRVEGFKTSARARFGEIPKMESLNNAGFKSVLEGTILNLTRSADRAGVKLPDKYDFTFSEQRRQLQLPEKALPSLALHLGDLANICQVLFDSKVHALSSLRRPQVALTDSNGGNDFVTKKPATNTVVGASILPYEVSFECFSSELGAVLAGFLNAKEAYIIKTINVEHGSTPDTQPGQGDPSGTPPPMDPRLMMMRRYGGMAPGLASRYGLAPGGGGPGGPQGMPAPMTPAPTTKAGQTALEEKPLRVSIALEVVKLAAAAPAPAAAAPARTPPKR